LSIFNSKKEIDFIKKTFKGSTVDAVCLNKDDNRFNKSFDEAMKEDYDYIVMNLQRKYFTEATHAGFIAMNKFIKSKNVPVIAFVDDLSICESPSTNMFDFKVPVSIITPKGTKKQFEEAGYNVKELIKTDAVASLLRSSSLIEDYPKPFDFIYVGMLREPRLSLVIETFNALTEAGLMCAFYGADAFYDDADGSTLNKAKFSVNKSVRPADVIGTVSKSKFSIVPRYEYASTLVPNRIYEDDSANSLILIDAKYGLEDLFDDDVRYNSIGDLVEMAKYYSERKNMYDMCLKKQHERINARWMHDKDELASAFKMIVGK
jgi:hypothetical protein